MPLDVKTSLEFFGGIADKIMVIVGVFLVIFAIAQFTPVYQLFSFSSFLFGVFFIVVGIALHFESLRLKVPSREGWGTILMCLSPLIIATALTVSLYAIVGEARVIPTSFRRGAESLILIDLDRPNAWLAPILFWCGIGVLIVGLVLKFSRDLF